jgi:hypothetical protein
MTNDGTSADLATLSVPGIHRSQSMPAQKAGSITTGVHITAPPAIKRQNSDGSTPSLQLSVDAAAGGNEVGAAAHMSGAISDTVNIEPRVEILGDRLSTRDVYRSLAFWEYCFSEMLAAAKADAVRNRGRSGSLLYQSESGAAGGGRDRQPSIGRGGSFNGSFNGSFDRPFDDTASAAHRSHHLSTGNVSDENTNATTGATAPKRNLLVSVGTGLAGGAMAAAAAMSGVSSSIIGTAAAAVGSSPKNSRAGSASFDFADSTIAASAAAAATASAGEEFDGKCETDVGIAGESGGTVLGGVPTSKMLPFLANNEQINCSLTINLNDQNTRSAQTINAAQVS